MNEMLAWGFGNFHSIFSLLKWKLILYTPVEAHVGASKQTSGGAAVAETTAKALVYVDHLSAGEAA